MDSLSRQDGLSRIEVICICGLAAVFVAVLLAIGANTLNDWHKGNDSATLNTAQSCGTIGLSDACLVPGCKGGKAPGHSFHIDENGDNFAYFDKVSNCLMGERPDGYNEAEVTTRDGRTYAPGNAVVIVANEGGTAVVDWAQGE